MIAPFFLKARKRAEYVSNTKLSEFWLRYFRKSLRGPPTHGVRKPPATKKENPKNPKARLSPEVNARSPKVNARSPKVNARSLKVDVKYFQAVFEELKVFEVSCWGVTVTGVSKISKFGPSPSSGERAQ